MADSSTKPITYRKLATNRRFLGGHQLMEGSTHLLLSIMGIGEDRYRRFYYRDIEAIFYTRTWANTIVHGILAGILLIPTLFILFIPSDQGDPSLFFLIFLPGLPFLVMAIAFLSGLVNGGQARLGIRTRVAEETLVTMSHRKAMEAIARIRDRIREEQPAIPPETMAARLAQMQMPAPPAS